MGRRLWIPRGGQKILLRPCLDSTTMVLGDFFDAVRSVASCLLRRRRDRPGTVLRSLCVAAFDFAARVNGQRLGQETRRALSRVLDLGALINDHFDEHRFCKRRYRELRKQLTGNETVLAAYRDHFRSLRRVERNRPPLQLPCRASILREVADYREEVVRLSLSTLAAIAFGQPNRADFARPRKPAAPDACLPHLFALVMLIQILDDLLDWRNDWHARLPSYVTAALLRCAGGAEGHDAGLRQVRTNVATAAMKYFVAIPREKHAFWPFAFCTYAAFFSVKLLGKLALRGNATREATDKAGLEVLHVSPRC
jgi:hypothetical protein